MVFSALAWNVLVGITLMFPTSSGLTGTAAPRQYGNPLVLSESTMERNYDKLADRLREKLKSLTTGEQYWVAIAGGPGSGT
jgi:hypothetical protein